VDFFSICLTERWKTKIDSEEVLLLIIVVFCGREDEGGGLFPTTKTRASVKFLVVVYTIIGKITHKMQGFITIILTHYIGITLIIKSQTFFTSDQASCLLRNTFLRGSPFKHLTFTPLLISAWVVPDHWYHLAGCLCRVGCDPCITLTSIQFTVHRPLIYTMYTTVHQW
jgi:hypothetical protein